MPVAVINVGVLAFAGAAILTLLGYVVLAVAVLALGVVSVGHWVWKGFRNREPNPVESDAGDEASFDVVDPDFASKSDALTGLNTRPAFFDIASTVLDGESEAVFALIELDHVQLIDDELSQARRDNLLREFGKFLSSSIRETDVAARWGGETFAVLYTQTTLEEGRIAVDRLRQMMARVPFEDFRDRTVTISSGMAPVRMFAQIGNASRQADEALRMARLDRSKSSTGDKILIPD